MFAALWRMFCRFSALDGDPDCGPEQKSQKPQSEVDGHGLLQQPDDKPGTYWTDLVDCPLTASDSSPQRLRSLPDEQKNQETQSKGRSR